MTIDLGMMRERTACHEAGHAVVGRVLGLDCGEATIKANATGTDDESHGYAVIANPVHYWQRGDGPKRQLADAYCMALYAENQILLAAGLNLRDYQESLRTQLRSLLPDTTNLDNLLSYFERLDVGSGYYLMKQGDPPEALYFIESGQVTAQLEFSDRNPVRLGTMRGGHVVGEIGFYLNQARTAAVVTDEPSTIYRLSMQTLKQMEQNDPEAASAFHQGIIRLISERATHLISTVNALQR
jgi:CRP-like cAMP-binding protein